MTKVKPKKPADFIVPLHMNGLQGRMLRMPPPKGKNSEILLVYGQHASLERVFGLAEAINEYAGVTMPDLPGFGGMESFYKLGVKPGIDNMADYLAAFIKLRYRNRRLTIGALSYGFLVTTRMLQKYPDIAQNVDLLISIEGFAHHDDFTFSKLRQLCYRTGARFFSLYFPAVFFRNVLLHPAVIRAFYSRTHNAKHKFEKVAAKERKRLIDFEIYLWRSNDVRTYMKSTIDMLKIDNCQRQVNLPLWHLSVKNDNYFDNRIVEQHLKIIFNGCQNIQIKLPGHSMTVIPDKKAAAPLLPAELRSLLRAQS